MIPFILAAIGGYLIGDSVGEDIDKKVDSAIPEMAEGGKLFSRKDKRFIFIGSDGQPHGLNYKLFGIKPDGTKVEISEHTTQAGAERKARVWEKTAYGYESWTIDAIPFADGGKMAEGGEVKNQYAGRSAEDIWNNETENQRLHFLIDHTERLMRNPKDYVAISKMGWDDLDYDVQVEFNAHKIMGEYAKGGVVYNFDVYLYNDDEDRTIKEKKRYRVKASSRNSAYDKANKKFPRPYFVELHSIDTMDEGGVMAKGGDKWIQEAVKHKGALRRTAKREGLIKGDEKLSMTDLKKLEKKGGKTAKRAHLAETLKKLKKK